MSVIASERGSVFADVGPSEGIKECVCMRERERERERHRECFDTIISAVFFSIHCFKQFLFYILNVGDGQVLLITWDFN